MLLLASTSDTLKVVSSSAITTDVNASFVDLNTSTNAVTPGRTNTAISTATTTTCVASPGSNVVRTIKTLNIRNRHATTAQTVTIILYDGTLNMELIQVQLLAGYCLQYDEGAGWNIYDSFGRILSNASQNTNGAAVNALNLVTLAADVTNNNGTANTIADVTGLSFAVISGETYWFQFVIDYTSAATTTGARFAISGPASPTRLAFRSQYALTTTTETVNNGLTAYDLPAASNATSAATTGNIAIIEGNITPSANGTVIARFASEVASSAIVAKAGSSLRWVRTK